MFVIDKSHLNQLQTSLHINSYAWYQVSDSYLYQPTQYKSTATVGIRCQLATDVNTSLHSTHRQLQLVSGVSFIPASTDW